MNLESYFGNRSAVLQNTIFGLSLIYSGLSGGILTSAALNGDLGEDWSSDATCAAILITGLLGLRVAFRASRWVIAVMAIFAIGAGLTRMLPTPGGFDQSPRVWEGLLLGLAILALPALAWILERRHRRAMTTRPQDSTA